MALFQRSVLNKYLKEIDDNKVKAAYQTFTAYFHNPERQENIKNSKEEQFQEGFLRELFVKILGYTLNPEPSYNLTTEFKNQRGAKKADGAVLKEGKAIGVIELKSTKTKDLESVRQQAFDYKANQPHCVYVITSNFEKLRFYINNAVDYEEFDLFNLKPERFKLLYLCLQADNLLRDLPLQVKEASLIQEENITKQLYKDYSQFKHELFADLCAHNLDKPVLAGMAEKEAKLLLFKESQKLLDRFLFIFFAEDSGLLPPNSISEIIKQWETLQELDEDIPLYSRYRKYFGYLDKGHKGKKYDIFAYNGGLFEPDAVLDSIEISDELLHKHTKTLSTYDFGSEVDVNILGHIFENSLNEIEEVSAKLEGLEADTKKGKRKKDGVFYTPKYITKYIVDNTVGKLCGEKKTELGIVEEDYYKPTEYKKTKGRKKERTHKAKIRIIALQKKLDEYRDWLLDLKICDPACGSGAFLNQALDFLITEHQYIDELKAKLLDSTIPFSDISNKILEQNIYGVDINEESVEIAKLSMWLRTAQKGRKLSTLSSNIKCGNSLIDDPEVAGEKAFNWQEQFPEVFEKGGFDVVIGNPPYVRAELLGESRPHFEKHYKVFNPAGDLFSYFYEQGFNLLKEKTGYFSYISNTFDKTTAGLSVREYLQNDVAFQKYIDFTEVQIFEGATTYPIILIAQNSSPKENSFTYIKIPKKEQAKVIDIEMQKPTIVLQSTLEKDNWSFKSVFSVALMDKLKALALIRSIYGKCYYGVKTALNEAFIVPKQFELGEHVKPIYEGKELSKWNNSDSIQQLILFESKWTKKTYGDDVSEEVALENLKSDFPDLMNQIMPFEERAKKRYDKGEFYWELRNCAYYDLFEKPKIVFPNLQNSNKFSFDNSGAYINAPAVILPTEDKFLVGILNSKLVWYFLTNICVVRSGGYIEVKPQYFEQIPIAAPSEEMKQNLLLQTETVMDYTAKFQKANGKLLRYLANQFNIETFSKKLQNWQDLEFSDFIKELNKAIKKAGGEQLSKKDEIEWMELFEEYKKEAQVLQTQITKTEAELDQLVYQLYGLTEEEIKIVEGGV